VAPEPVERFQLCDHASSSGERDGLVARLTGHQDGLIPLGSERKERVSSEFLIGKKATLQVSMDAAARLAWRAIGIDSP
jgi:hypothetical protein